MREGIYLKDPKYRGSLLCMLPSVKGSGQTPILTDFAAFLSLPYAMNLQIGLLPIEIETIQFHVSCYFLSLRASLENKLLF